MSDHREEPQDRARSTPRRTLLLVEGCGPGIARAARVLITRSQDAKNVASGLRRESGRWPRSAVRNWKNKTVRSLELDDGGLDYPLKEHLIYEAVLRVSGGRSPVRHAQGQEPQVEVSRRHPQALAPEAHRPGPCGRQPLSPVAARWHGPRAAAPRATRGASPRECAVTRSSRRWPRSTATDSWSVSISLDLESHEDPASWKSARGRRAEDRPARPAVPRCRAERDAILSWRRGTTRD